LAKGAEGHRARFMAVRYTFTPQGAKGSEAQPMAARHNFDPPEAKRTKARPMSDCSTHGLVDCPGDNSTFLFREGHSLG